MQKNFHELANLFKQLFEYVHSQNLYFTFTTEQIADNKIVFHFYVHGSHKVGLKIWIAKSWGREPENIYLSFGPNFESMGDNAWNEQITCEVENGNRLVLRLLMMSHSGDRADDPESVVRAIWKHQISLYI